MSLLRQRHPRRQQQISPHRTPFHINQLHRIIQFKDAVAGDGFARIATAKDFRRVEKHNTMRVMPQQERRVHFSATFHQQAHDIFLAQFFQEPAKINL